MSFNSQITPGSIVLPNDNTIMGNAGNLGAAVQFSGDGTVNNTGVITIGANKITFGKMQQIASDTVMGNITGGLANATAVSLGTLTEATSSVLTLTGWTNATIGSPTIQVLQAGASQSGYLSSTDWNTFNGKQSTLTFSDSLVNAAGTVTLVGDTATPGASKYYGTNAGSALGYYAIPVGTVTSVALADGSGTPIYAITGSPVTGAGTLTFTLNTQPEGYVFAGPGAGAPAQPTFRALTYGDIPAVVTSVGLADLSTTALYNITNTPVTGAATIDLTLKTVGDNQFFAGPVSGGAAQPGWRGINALDLPGTVQTTALTSGYIWVGNGSNIAQADQMSGDATLNNTAVLTLATVNSNVGTFGNGTNVGQFTVNAKGLITAAANVPMPGLLVAPTFVSVGTAAVATATSVTPGLPAGYQNNDIFIAYLQTANQNVVPPPVGWAKVGPCMGSGTDGAAGATAITVFWRRSTASETAPTFTFGGGDHVYAVVACFRGCVTVGDPFHFAGSTRKTATTTAFTTGTENVSFDNSLIVTGVSRGYSSAAAQYSAWANASLTGVTNRFDAGTASGVGGGLAITTGVLATAGLLGVTTATEANATLDSQVTLALIPNGVNNLSGIERGCDVQTFLSYGNDAYAIPYGAKFLEIICIGGGGPGGAGVTTTAAGGGGGGGGAWNTAWVAVSQLTGPYMGTSVGIGGVGGATNNPALGTYVQLPSGVVICGAAGGSSGAAASSNSGGAGGQGGSINPLTPQATGSPGTQGLGGSGAGGGTGATTGASGGNADWGGGGGGGGKNGAASSGGGSSAFGGGGGSGGGTNAGTVLPGGDGGGQGQATSTTPGASGTSSGVYTLGGQAGNGGNASTTTGGNGAQPGGGGGGGGPAANSGGNGGDGAITFIAYF